MTYTKKNMQMLYNFSDILGQDKAVYTLKSLIIKRKINKTFLFSGIEGTGKKIAAFAFAASCNCQNIIYNNKMNPCGLCKSCRMIADNHHPDILHLEAKKIITVANIRKILEYTKLKAYKAKQKVVIVSSAEKMNIEASNAFLKFLEEPNLKTTIILITTSKTDLIPTVFSRCEEIKFIPINLEIIKTILVKNGSTLELAKTVANLSYGNLSKAIELISQDWNDKRIWLISNINSLCCNKKSKHINSQKWLLFSEVLSKEESNIEEYLTLIQIWLKDVLLYRFSPKKISNIDMSKKIASASKIMNYQTIINNIIAVQEAKDSLTLNVNLRLTLDTMLICMAEN